MEDDKCEVDYCRNKSDLNYLGRQLCDSCWNKLCDKELKQETEVNGNGNGN